MGKKLRFWTGALFGAALQYFYDPQSGQSRRAILREQVGNWLVEAKDGMRGEGRARRPFTTPTDMTDGVLRSAGGPLSAVDINERQSTQF